MDRFSNGSGDTFVLVLRRGSEGVTGAYAVRKNLENLGRTDGHTDGHTDGRTDGQTDIHICGDRDVISASRNEPALIREL